jgi:Mce-associated membrane protein
VPPHRRRPAPTSGQAPPIRRPKVAGLRNRPGYSDDAEQTTVLPRITDPEPADLEPADLEPADLEPADLEPADESPVEEPVDASPDDDAEPVEAEPEIDPETNEPPAVAERKPRSVPKPSGIRPAGKRRATGAARPTDLSAAETDAGAEPKRPARHAKADTRPARTRAQTQISVAIILTVVAVVLAGLAVFFRGQAEDLTSGDPNTALTDSAATSQIKGQLTNAIKQTFSYNYTDLASTEKAVKENLTGKALCEYNQLFGEVKQYAPEQKIVLDTTVRELAIIRIDGDRAEALVYINQLSTRADVNKTVAVSGQFAVQAHRDGDHWKITEFDMFGQPLVNGKPAPTC